MQRVASGSLLHLSQQRLFVSEDQVTKLVALTNRRLKWGHGNNRRRTRQLNHGTAKCPPGSQPSECTNASFAAYRRRLDYLASFHYGDE